MHGPRGRYHEGALSLYTHTHTHTHTLIHTHTHACMHSHRRTHRHTFVTCWRLNIFIKSPVSTLIKVIHDTSPSPLLSIIKCSTSNLNNNRLTTPCLQGGVKRDGLLNVLMLCCVTYHQEVRKLFNQSCCIPSPHTTSPSFSFFFLMHQSRYRSLLFLSLSSLFLYYRSLSAPTF